MRLLNNLCRPSKSLNESIAENYHRAELIGHDIDGDCEREYAGCKTSMLDLFSEE